MAPFKNRSSHALRHVRVRDPLAPRASAEYLTAVEDVDRFRGSLSPWIEVVELSDAEYAFCLRHDPVEVDLVLRVLERELRANGSGIRALAPETIRGIMSCVEERLLAQDALDRDAGNGPS